MLTNLLGNAVKFTQRGEVVLEVARGVSSAAPLELQFTVRDTGIGIPRDKQPLLFQAFSQVDSSTTRRFGGTGLGLAICARLVSLMGGRIWLESDEGQGSRFYFTAQLGPAPPAVRPSPAAATILAGLPLLIMDDNSTNRRILLQMTASWRMDAHAVESGQAALLALDTALAAGQPYRVVLLDSRMPGMDGFQVAQQMQCNPRLAGAVIMMLTSAGQRGDAARCRQLGISAYLLKPIRKLELLEAILTVLGQRQEAGLGAPLVTRHTLREARACLRILVAEDNPVNQALILRLLEKQGHSPVLAVNRREAVELARREPFDLVLMDVQMPEIDGFAATAAIRELQKPGDPRLLIYAMTAHALKGDRERCLAAGMDGYLAKPVRFAELQELLASAVARRARAGRGQWQQAGALAQASGDRLLLRELARIFLQESPRLVQQLHAALEAGDGQAWRRAAHSLKGELACLAAPQAQRLAAQLEQMLLQAGSVAAAAALAELEAELACLRPHLEAFCEVRHENSACRG